MTTGGVRAVNGGRHADNPIDIQEFMIQPVAAPTIADGVRMGSEIFAALKKAKIFTASSTKRTTRPIVPSSWKTFIALRVVEPRHARRDDGPLGIGVAMRSYCA